jgi:hypothetical protein
MSRNFQRTQGSSWRERERERERELRSSRGWLIEYADADGRFAASNSELPGLSFGI